MFASQLRGATLLTGLLALLVALPLRGQSAGQLNFNSTDWPPYYVDGRGLARQIIETCLPPAGYTPRFSAIGVDLMFPALQNGVLDGHVMSRTEERERYLEFGREPLFRDGYHAVVRRGSGIQVKNLGDLDRLKLGHLRGVRYTPEYLEYLRRRQSSGRLVEAESNDELLAMLLDGRVDAFVALASTTRWQAAQAGAKQRIEVLPFVLKNSDYYLALTRTSRRVSDRRKALDAFDACLAAAKQDGRYARWLAAYDLEH